MFHFPEMPKTPLFVGFGVYGYNNNGQAHKIWEEHLLYSCQTVNIYRTRFHVKSIFIVLFLPLQDGISLYYDRSRKDGGGYERKENSFVCG